MTLILRGGTLIDGTGVDPTSAVMITVEGNRIATVSRQPTGHASAKEVVDLTGLTVLPGLIDAHAHLGFISVKDPGALPAAVVAAEIFRNAELCLRSGHTTVRDVGGVDGGLKAAIDRGLIPGPRIYPSGPLLCQTGGHGDLGHPFVDPIRHPPFRGLPGLAQVSIVCNGPQGVREAARAAFRRGATQLKMCISGGVVSLSDRLEDTQFTIEELAAAVNEARARGTYVTAHAHNTDAIRNGLAAGIRCFEHGSFLDSETAALMERADAALVPTLTVTNLLAEQWQEWGIPEDTVPRLEGVSDAMANAIKIADAAGVRVGSGTDLLGPNQQRRGLEIVLKAKILGPMRAIVSATAINAAILGVADDLGTIEPGKLADLIAVDGDPLTDPDVLDDPDRIVIVVKDGELVKEQE